MDYDHNNQESRRQAFSLFYQQGKGMFWGALTAFATLALISYGFSLVERHTPITFSSTDSTDSLYGGRSGVKLRTDYGTGCQYLETSFGGITPRLDAQGEHICNITHPAY